LLENFFHYPVLTQKERQTDKQQDTVDVITLPPSRGEKLATLTVSLTFTSSERFMRICCRMRPSSARTRFCHSDDCCSSSNLVVATGWLLVEDTLILHGSGTTCQSPLCT